MVSRKPAVTSASARIVLARIAAGFATPDAAAIHLGVLAAVYRRHEKGLSKVKPDELRRYAEAFGVSPGWLATGVGAGPLTDP